MPYSWGDEWEKANNKEFYEHFERFMQGSAFKSGVEHFEGIFCLRDGRDGKYIIVGRVFEKTKDGELIGEQNPITLPTLSQLEEELLRAAVKRHLGLEGEFKFWFVTQFR